MKRLLVLILLSLHTIVDAQNIEGVRFVQGLNWAQILTKAKAENKYIFVDCYATWCGPCKLMDAEVYPTQIVGSAVNENFISVKIQMDKTSNDDENTKLWYDIADAFRKTYTIIAFPTFLFFSPDGNPVHKSAGARNDTAFITLTKEALNPDKQYYVLLEHYKPGLLDTSEMKGIALKYYRSKKQELAEKILLDYFDHIATSEKFDETNLKYLTQFTDAPKIQNLAYDYLSGLSNSEFHDKKNMNFAIKFCNGNNIKVQELCITYIKHLSRNQIVDKEKRDSSNLKFLISLSTLPPVEKVLANYLKSIDRKEFSKLMSLKAFEQIVNRPNKTPGIKNIIIHYLTTLKPEQLGILPNINLAIGCKDDEKVRTFINNRYILLFNKKDLKSKPAINILIAFTKSVNDPGFQLLYNNQILIDSVMATIEEGQRTFYSKDIVNKVVNNIIATGLKIEDYIDAAKKANKISLADVDKRFEEFKAKIQDEYPKVDADQIIMYNKWILADELVKKGIAPYELKIKYRVEYLDKFGIGDSYGGYGPDFGYNEEAWDIFLNSGDLNQLNSAIKWMEGVVSRNKNYVYLDTYANLLYKVGRVHEALALEATTPMKTTFEKMKKGVPTWPEEKSNLDKAK